MHGVTETTEDSAVLALPGQNRWNKSTMPPVRNVADILNYSLQLSF